jgi:hypothetical protein
MTHDCARVYHGHEKPQVYHDDIKDSLRKMGNANPFREFAGVGYCGHFGARGTVVKWTKDYKSVPHRVATGHLDLVRFKDCNLSDYDTCCAIAQMIERRTWPMYINFRNASLNKKGAFLIIEACRKNPLIGMDIEKNNLTSEHMDAILQMLVETPCELRYFKVCKGNKCSKDAKELYDTLIWGRDHDRHKEYEKYLSKKDS